MIQYAGRDTIRMGERSGAKAAQSLSSSRASRGPVGAFCPRLTRLPLQSN